MISTVFFLGGGCIIPRNVNKILQDIRRYFGGSTGKSALTDLRSSQGSPEQRRAASNQDSQKVKRGRKAVDTEVLLSDTCKYRKFKSFSKDIQKKLPADTVRFLLKRMIRLRLAEIMEMKGHLQIFLDLGAYLNVMVIVVIIWGRMIYTDVVITHE